jgi:lipopolysaccharide biosynthesis glycosyltransferase
MHIVFAGNHRFVPYIGVAIHSILRHHASGSSIRFSVLENGLTDADREGLLALCRFPHVKLDFKRVDDALFDGAPLMRFRSCEPYFRLLIPDLFPESSRVLYLDGDILVCDDLSALYAFDLKGNPLGACDDVSATKHMERLGLDRYYNSGVLLMDLDLWRRDNLFKKTMDCLQEHRERLLFEDQDVLNLALAGKIATMDLRWNFFSIFYSKSLAPSFFSEADMASVSERPGIIHFSGKFKPYSIQNATRINWKYHTYARRTSFSRRLLLRALRGNLGHLKWKMAQVFGGTGASR